MVKKKNDEQKTARSDRMPGLERDLDYSNLVKLIFHHTKRNLNMKFGFQIAFGSVALLLVGALTALLVVFFCNIHAITQDTVGVIVAVVTGCATYFASLVGVLAIVLNYMFNKNETAENYQILKEIIRHDETKLESGESGNSLETEMDSYLDDIMEEQDTSLLKTDLFEENSLPETQTHTGDETNGEL